MATNKQGSRRKGTWKNTMRAAVNNNECKNMHRCKHSDAAMTGKSCKLGSDNALAVFASTECSYNG